MKVKTSIFRKPDEAEDAVNNWLTEQQVKICHVTQSQCEWQGWFFLIMSIFYEKPCMLKQKHKLPFEVQERGL